MSKHLMKLNRTGLILYVYRYKECVFFYQKILKLPILFDNKTLTCFELGAMYLIVEIDDENSFSRKDGEPNRTCIRMNVENVKEYADRLKSEGIDVNYGEYSWGTVDNFLDPDGNLLAFKYSEKFEQHINEYTK